MQIVNGYACSTCGDVAKAQKFIDPSSVGPGGVPKPGQAKDHTPAGSAAGAGANASVNIPAFAVDAARRGVNNPLPEGARGSALNLLA